MYTCLSQRCALWMGVFLIIAQAVSVQGAESRVPGLQSVQVWAPDDLADKDRFGGAVRLHSGIAAVGASASDQVKQDAGAVYLFTKGAAGWQQQARLTPSDAEVAMLFGSDLALDKERLAVGAPGLYAGAGGVYLYRKSGDSWQQATRFLLPESQQFTQFGAALALSGSWLAAGAAGYDASGKDSGVVMLYRQSTPDEWKEGILLEPEQAQAGERFGSSVAMAEGHLAVGAPAAEGGGAVYLFRERDGRWQQVARLSESLGPKAAFGGSVAIRGKRLLVGARFADDGAGQATGAAYLYTEENEGEWGRVAVLRSPDGGARDQFADALALGDTLVIVSAPRDDSVGNNAGAVFAWKLAGEGPEFVGPLHRATAEDYDEFGRSLSIDVASSRLLVGTPADRLEKGAYTGVVSLYEW